MRHHLTLAKCGTVDCRAMALCSVIVPAFNVQAFIVEAVESALSQTYAELEVIVVNDGSTDETARVLEPFRDRITYVEQPNRGLGAARNRALREARGELIALLDGDDVMFPAGSNESWDSSRSSLGSGSRRATPTSSRTVSPMTRATTRSFRVGFVSRTSPTGSWTPTSSSGWRSSAASSSTCTGGSTSRSAIAKTGISGSGSSLEASGWHRPRATRLLPPSGREPQQRLKSDHRQRFHAHRARSSSP